MFPSFHFNLVILSRIVTLMSAVIIMLIIFGYYSCQRHSSGLSDVALSPRSANRGEITINPQQPFLQKCIFRSSAGMHSLFHNQPDVRTAALPPSCVLLQSPPLSAPLPGKVSGKGLHLHNRLQCHCGRALGESGRHHWSARPPVQNKSSGSLCSGRPLSARAHIHMLMNKLIKYDKREPLVC